MKTKTERTPINALILIMRKLEKVSKAIDKSAKQALVFDTFVSESVAVAAFEECQSVLSFAQASMQKYLDTDIFKNALQKKQEKEEISKQKRVAKKTAAAAVTKLEAPVITLRGVVLTQKKVVARTKVVKPEAVVPSTKPAEPVFVRTIVVPAPTPPLTPPPVSIVLTASAQSVVSDGFNYENQDDDEDGVKEGESAIKEGIRAGNHVTDSSSLPFWGADNGGKIRYPRDVKYKKTQG